MLSTSKWKKPLSLLILTIQTTTMVLLLRYSRSSSESKVENSSLPSSPPQEDDMYLSSTVIVVSEAIKILVCLIVIQREYDGHDGSVASLVSYLTQEVILKPTETAKLFIPAFLYTIQNNLLFLALTNLDAATYQVRLSVKDIFVIICLILINLFHVN